MLILSKFKDCNWIDASPYKYSCITICITADVVFCEGLNLVLQHYCRTGQNKGRYHKEELLLLLV